MIRLLQYRRTILTLVLVFSLFNIGLPVVIASCPMLKYGSAMACCRVNEDPGSLILTTHNNYSCCNTVLAAERNTNAFVPVKLSVQAPVEQVEFIFSTPTLNDTPVISSGIVFASSAPPTVIDIPIRVSSLLI